MSILDVQYIIVSHRWTSHEVSYVDFKLQLNDYTERDGEQVFQEKRGRTIPPGWQKIFQACYIAREHKCEFFWLDSCCIDKTSSAELQEAVNSMFYWYRRSKLCVAFLPDVESLPVPLGSTAAYGRYTTFHRSDEDQFKKSDWFRRGWTLQELLAPVVLHFFSSTSHFIGDKMQMIDAVTGATGIGKPYLTREKPIYSASVFERMRWVSDRQTSRPEDIAYCLLGIFDVNMPLICGEGTRAFTRLQLEIMKTSHDETDLRAQWIRRDGFTRIRSDRVQDQ